MNTLLKSLAALALLLVCAAAGVFIVKEMRPQPPAPLAAAPAPVIVVQQPAPAPAAQPAQVAPAAPVAVSTPAPAPAAPAAAPAPAAPTAAATPGPSSIMTTAAWNDMTDNKYDQAVTDAQKCIDTFKQQALDQQKALSAPVPTSDPVAVNAQWALNDVGTSYFILGQAYEKLNKPKDATTAYQFLVSNLAYAQCWDPKGWFWPPAKAAKDRIKALQLDTLQ